MKTLRVCPFDDGWELRVPFGMSEALQEELIRDHLDYAHPGWTLADVKAAAARYHERHATGAPA